MSSVMMFSWPASCAIQDAPITPAAGPLSAVCSACSRTSAALLTPPSDFITSKFAPAGRAASSRPRYWLITGRTQASSATVLARSYSRNSRQHLAGERDLLRLQQAALQDARANSLFMRRIGKTVEQTHGHRLNLLRNQGVEHHVQRRHVQRLQHLAAKVEALGHSWQRSRGMSGGGSCGCRA